jgi:hypothetical protein
MVRIKLEMVQASKVQIDKVIAETIKYVIKTGGKKNG